MIWVCSRSGSCLVAPTELEHVLLSHPEVSECLVFGRVVPGSKDDAITAAVVLKRGTGTKVLRINRLV